MNERSADPAGNEHATCRWCHDDLEHCHESLVVHERGDVHCMDDDCSTPPDLHHLVVRCSEFACGCAQSARTEVA
jgi:hypothetical protein